MKDPQDSHEWDMLAPSDPMAYAALHVPSLIYNTIADNQEDRLEKCLMGDRKALKDYNRGKAPEDVLSLAVAVFGLDRYDPRRKEWERVSKPWGFGSLRALDTAGIMKRGTRIKSLDNETTVSILDSVCIRAIETGNVRAFDKWITQRVTDPTGSELESEETKRTETYRRERAATLRSLEWYISSLNLDQLKAVETVVRSMGYDPKADYPPQDEIKF